MNELKPLLNTRSFWLTGVGGFGFAFLFSLLGGNLLETSVKRGVAGFFMILAAHAIVRIWISVFVTPGSGTSTAIQTVPEQKGTNFDVSLPSEVPDAPPVASDFQPWVLEADGEPLTDTQVQNLADAIRTIQN